MKSLLFLTNPSNSEPAEDQVIGKHLEKEFRVTLCHPSDACKYEDRADVIFVHNIWPTQQYREELVNMYERFAQKKLKVYNPFSGSGDMRGKDYLVRLFREKYPVIPSISSMKDFSLLPHTEYYMVKPKFGGSSEGIRKLARRELINTELQDAIIQPFVDFKHETSFYYIDGDLQYVLYTPYPKKRWDLMPFEPTVDQLEIAQRLVSWNTLPYGIQRIDFGITDSGDMLLIEIEDWCPYLSLREIPNDLSNRFLATIMRSLIRIL